MSANGPKFGRHNCPQIIAPGSSCVKVKVYIFEETLRLENLSKVPLYQPRNVSKIFKAVAEFFIKRHSDLLFNNTRLDARIVYLKSLDWDEEFSTKIPTIGRQELPFK